MDADGLSSNTTPGASGVSQASAPEVPPGVIAVPAIMARFVLHVRAHGLYYAVGWLVLDVSGAWATITSQAAGVCG
jgi:hypothetical protein